LQPVQFSPQAKQKLEAIVGRYPEKVAATLPALHLAQAEFGHLSEEVMQLVADSLGVSLAHVYGVVTFYTMFRRTPAGKNVLMVCTNVSCMLRGAYDILGHIERRLGIKPGETTPDGMFTLVEEECLAACANAPMFICGQKYFLDLTPEKVDQALEELRKAPQSEDVG
jgi:NADH-quinone oxidoreductase E subunit